MNYKEEIRKSILEGFAEHGVAVRINQPDFLACQWKMDNERGEWYSQCFEFIGGRWEGFISTRAQRPI